MLVAWLAALEKEGRHRLTELHWDGSRTYWIEADGQRIHYPDPLAALEFRE
jgi:hypothetical protein